MGKQILIVLGGGRPKGNTAQLAASFARGAEAAGHTVETISLMKNEVKGCLGCNACRFGKPCVQRDAFNELAPKIKAADCIVFASPCISGQFPRESRPLLSAFTVWPRRTQIPRWAAMRNIRTRTVSCS